MLNRDDMTIELFDIGWGQRNEGRGRSGQRNEGRQGSFLDGISTPLSSNMTLQSVEQTGSFLVLSLGPLVHFRWNVSISGEVEATSGLFPGRLRG